ncbi:galactokinase [Paenibacillus cellulosilyticus]|uniref:Galactokinase n=1 Tax=Paenibacillus cellulosilyticus TaxID=375489 RepID=A0A2V2YMW5_9BACL|nr:galactokinase family protein [Paenibacillus cellulosilyticus]PWV95917.1 galactokinase [Paenibacillus cellulosilyticus]QKS48840.1 galactokinase [Paenibacillus cellulosilyticus]
MNTIDQTIEWIQTDRFKSQINTLYGEEQLSYQLNRYQSLVSSYKQNYADGPLALFSSPGRSEIGGNHTDHNHGKVLAGSIDLDTIAAAARVEEPVITFISEGYPGEFKVDLTNLAPIPGESATMSIVRGIAAGFLEFGYSIGGFNAYVSTNVLSASGLSSSASFEMLFCSILSTFYNAGALDSIAMSKIGQYAENHYWNKPSGLLDQMACAHGGLIAIDFANPLTPIISPISFDFQKNGYSLVIVNTGGNHADLTEDYGAVPYEMRAVAKALGAEVCRGLTPNDIYDQLQPIRQQCGDRAVLRALHYLEENNRVDAQVESLVNGDMDRFLRLVKESGESSWKWLQNCYRNVDVGHQDITVTLAITEMFLKQLGAGACRVHGGGFAGVIAAILPNESVSQYVSFIERTTGNATYQIHIREYGAICLNEVMQ